MVTLVDVFDWPGVLLNPMLWIVVYLVADWAWRRWRRLVRKA